MKTYRVMREPHIQAPQQGFSVYSGAVTYTRPDGPGMMETIYCEARNPMYSVADPAKRIGRYAYMPTFFRRCSADNGRTWEPRGDVYEENPAELAGQRAYPPGQFLDSENDLMVTVQCVYAFDYSQRKSERFSDDGIAGQTQQMVYSISRDGGTMWESAKPLVHKGAEYDDIHWGPGLFRGRNGGFVGPPRLKRKDGDLLATMFLNLEDGNRYQVALVHGRWKADLSGIEWEFSDYIRIPPTHSTQGACEADVAELTDGRMLVTMRACGDRENHTFPSLKFYSISTDNGWTFTPPEPLSYDDGEPVWSPSSFHRLFRSSGNGRLYFIANILDAPSYDSEPRWPLCIGEIDEARPCLIRETVGLIKGLPDDLSPELREAAEKRTKGRRYSNWTQYEDRETGELALFMAEQPKTDWQDFTSDCFRFRITLPDA